MAPSIADLDGPIMMDFLLPTGLLIVMPCEGKMSLLEVRQQLWEQVLQLPGAEYINRPDSYVFIGITTEAEEEQFDDSERIQDLSLVIPLLEVSIPKVTRDANRLNSKISDALGVPVTHLNAVKNEEFQSCRTELGQYGRELAVKRAEFNNDERALYYYPPALDLNVDLPMYITENIHKEDDSLLVNVWEDPQKDPFTLKISAVSTPSQIVMAYVHCKYLARGHSEEELRIFVCNAVHLYRLKVAGRLEYLLKECLIHQYKYIRDCLSCHTVPDLHIVHKDDIYKAIPSEKAIDFPQQCEEEIRRPLIEVEIYNRLSNLSIWDLDGGQKYCVKINNLTRKRPLGVEVHVVAQVYHGTHKLCASRSTRKLGWNQLFEFSISLQNLPRSARLCLAVVSSEKGKPDKAIYWVNMQVFDWKGRLQSGIIELGVWPKPQTLETGRVIYPEGFPGGNLDPESPLLEFRVLTPADNMFVYPDNDEIGRRVITPGTASQQRKASFVQGHDLSRVDTIQNKGVAAALTLIEKDFLWKNRISCMEFDPNLLPRLIQAINWEDRHHVVEMYRLLQTWPVEKVSLTSALQLLDTDFPDPCVRALAVKCLDNVLTDELLLLYMMPLIQALKFDCGYDSPLCRFLLMRALYNRRVGQRLFWQLRSEFDNQICRQRLLPVLEVYCRYCGPVLASLVQEVSALDCLVEVSQEIRNKAMPLRMAGEFVKERLQEPEMYKTTSTLSSVIDPRYESDSFNVDKCRVMSSKMKPMWLEWSNPDCLASVSQQEKIKLIFKNGDDLRQDMLIIMCLKLMDTIWKYSDCDYKLTIYECLAMGGDVGLIEVIQNASTLGSIQTKSGMISVSGALNDMLYKRNVGSYVEIVKDFTVSCAAYCVATYVLGISDRHPDNIMVTDNGQVFHIDFGHILNNRKEKFGIRRERVPFVLTDDFIRIITKCKEDFVNTPEWAKFMLQCFSAYMTLRQHANLFITLFKLMMHSGLRELSCAADLNELRRTLAIDKSDTEAGKFFVQELEKSYGGQWSTKMDWFFHRMVHKSKS